MSSLAATRQKAGFWSVLWDYLTTVDHKKIAHLYLIGGFFFFILAGIEALIIRIQLMFPNSEFVSAQFYNELMTMHGTTMIFLAAMPLLFALMNAIIPLQIGARDVAFPFINSLGFWLFVFGGLLLHVSWFTGGAPDAGWTAYAPLSIYSEGHGLDFYSVGLQIAGFGTLMAGINFIVTVISMRGPGMTFMRMPLFTWASFVANILILFAFPALTIGLFLLTFDRLFGANFFEPSMGGNVIIWEHLFWIFGHPEVYILILPAFGVFSEVISTFSRKRLFGYSSMVFATVLIAFLGFLVWAHHMFTVGLGPIANSIFAVATMAIAIPTGIKIFNWLLTMWGGSIKFTSPMVIALGFIPSFTVGGMTGIMLASAASDFLYHDTYFVVAHFHYVIVGGTVLGIFAGLIYWWPKMFGKILNEKLNHWFFWLLFIGFHLTFFVQHFLGLMGMPRRYWTFLEGQGLDLFNLISTIGAFLMAFAVLIFVYNIIITSRNGEKAGADPWEDGRTLEWSIPSPPPYYNFKQLPLTRGLDPLWIEKTEGNGKMLPGEPLGDIHMPNNSFIPFMFSLGLFLLGLGVIYQGPYWILGIIGFLVWAGSMFVRSFKDDLGYYIPKEELEKEGDGS